MALAMAAERRVGPNHTQVLAQTAWVFATTGQSHAQVFTALAKAAEPHVGDFPSNFITTLSSLLSEKIAKAIAIVIAIETIS